MVAYNMEFLQLCFQSKAHPYQHKWDVLDELFPNKNIFEIQLNDLQSLLKGSLLAPSISSDMLEVMYDRMTKWWEKKFKDNSATIEAQTLATHWKVHEAWMACQLCSLHVHILVDYRITSLQHHGVTIEVQLV